MVEVLFTYKGIETIIQCKISDKMKDIINQFITKTQIIANNIYYLYNGDKINEELTYEEQANGIDRQRKKMNILVNDKQNNIIINNNGNIIKSKDIICPECKENILIKIKDYKINLYECKNNHIKNNILFEEYENLQNIDISKIKCDKCNDKSINDTFNNQFFICNTCNLKLCPLCKSVHNINHNIIDYNNRNYICNKHNDSYIKYCKDCKENMCILCEKEHKNHNTIYLGDMIIEKSKLSKERDELKANVDKLKKNIEEIKNMLNKVLNNIEIYYKISNDIINNYENQKRNYYILEKYK